MGTPSTPVEFVKKLPGGGLQRVGNEVTIAGSGGGGINVIVIDPIPAGNNNIGDVDVASLPNTVLAGMASLPTGTNNIGDVDIASIAAGETHIGSVGGNMAKVSVEMTRPADTTAYGVGDVVSNSTVTTTLMEFANLTRVNAGSGYLVRVNLFTDKKSIVPRMRIHLFNVNTPTVAVDNAQMKLLYADAAKYIGFIDLPAMTTPVDTANSTWSYADNDTLRKAVMSAIGSRSIFAMMEALDAFTPASAQKFTLSITLENN